MKRHKKKKFQRRKNECKTISKAEVRNCMEVRSEALEINWLEEREQGGWYLPMSHCHRL